MSFNLLVLHFELQLLNIDTEDSTYVAPHSAQTISSKQYIRNKNAERCKKKQNGSRNSQKRPSKKKLSNKFS